MNTSPKASPLKRTLETLLTPLSGDSADEWRYAVNRDLRRLTGADVAFFRVSDGSPTRVDPLSAEVLDARDAYRRGDFRSVDPWAVQRTAPGDVVVGGFRELLGVDWYRGSEYYEELLRPRAITDYVGAQIGTDDGGHVLLSCFNVGPSRGQAHVTTVTRRLRSIVPALKVGIGVWLTVRPRLPELGGMVDEVPEAILLCDARGRTVHANSALVRLLEPDSERDRIRDALEAIARETTRARSGGAREIQQSAREREISTSRARYRVCCVADDGLLKGDARGGILLMVQRRPKGVDAPEKPIPSGGAAHA